MALRVFYPASRCVRSHPYWNNDDEFVFHPIRFEGRCSRRNKFEGEWERLLKGLFQVDNSTESKERKTDNTPAKTADDKFSFDVELSGFEPENIKVKTIGRKLIVEANKEENDEEDGIKSFSRRHFHKSIILPETVKPEDVTSALNGKGVLCITAPVMSLPAPEETERDIEVEKEKLEDNKDELQTENIESE